MRLTKLGMALAAAQLVLSIGGLAVQSAQPGFSSGGTIEKAIERSSVTTPDVVLTDAQKDQAIKELRQKHLAMPIAGIDAQRLKGSFYEKRGGQLHHAVDILSPRNTPVVAVENGKLARLFTSKAGGLTIYHVDPSNQYVYYYAHLEKYADGLKDGDQLKKGQVIGYVGTSGNAPENTPHLHFSVGVMGPDKKTWQAADVDPYEVFK